MQVSEGPLGGEAVDVAVVMVTWNSEKHLPGMLDGLSAALEGIGRWQLVVADNASGDSTLSCLARLAPDALIVRTGGNQGYAGGVNAAVAAAAPTRAYLVLNPDVRLTPGVVRVLCNGLTAQVGVTVPRLTDSAGRLAHSLRREPTVLRALGEAVLGGRLSGRFPALGEVVRDPTAYEHNSAADWATGAVLMVSQECMAAVGPWDESFFLYSEETDFLLRARDAGYRVRLVPSARAVHGGGESHVSPLLWSRLVVNRVRLYRRRHGLLKTSGFWAAVLLGELLRSAYGGPTHRAAVRALVRSPAKLPG